MHPTPSLALSSIMTHFDLGPWAEARGRLAATLADEHGARFIGVAAELPLTIVSDLTYAVESLSNIAGAGPDPVTELTDPGNLSRHHRSPSFV